MISKLNRLLIKSYIEKLLKVEIMNFFKAVEKKKQILDKRENVKITVLLAHFYYISNLKHLLNKKKKKQKNFRGGIREIRKKT